MVIELLLYFNGNMSTKVEMLSGNLKKIILHTFYFEATVYSKMAEGEFVFG